MMHSKLFYAIVCANDYDSKISQDAQAYNGVYRADSVDDVKTFIKNHLDGVSNVNNLTILVDELSVSIYEGGVTFYPYCQ